jgi:hypothetical protein
MPKLTPDSLFDYAIAYTKNRSEQKKDRLLPTFREAAKAFRCKLSDIQDAISDYQGAHYLGPVVGYQCGGGVAEITKQGDYLIEADSPELYIQ